MVDHIAFGIILDDIVLPTGDTHMGILGGGGPQTAWGMAAALGSGARVGLVAGVGSDLPAGALAPLTAAHLNFDGVRTTAWPTPRAWQILEFDGRRAQIWRVPGQTLGPQLARGWDVLPASYRNARSFHWGIHPGDTRWLNFAHELTAAEHLVSIEPFKSPDTPLSDDALGAVLRACTIFSPNWEEAVHIVGSDQTETIVERCRALGGRYLVLRRGTEGAEAWDLAAGRGLHVPAVPVQTVDVVGAGNAFCGAFVARFDDGLADALSHASVAASYMVEQVGIPPRLPDRVDYEHRRATVLAGIQSLMHTYHTPKQTR